MKSAPDDTRAMNAEMAQQPRCFPTGVGQSDTHAIVLSNGRPNPHPSAGTDYATITGRDIVAMVASPQSVAKVNARWFLPSTYAGPDARDHAVQRQHGQFWWLCVDVDENNLELIGVETAIAAVAPGAARLIYSTRSSTAEARRWRALLPLDEPLVGADYTDTAKAFFALLTDASGGVLIPDPKLALTGQLVFLPNRGAFYEQNVSRGPRLHLGPDHPVIRHRNNDRAKAEAALREAAERRQRRAAARPAPGDGTTPVERFNAAHRVADLLDRYGYTRLGDTEHWRSPHQTSNTFATRDCGDHWVSLSGSDATAGLGNASKSGAQFGDAFDLYVGYEHGGKFDRAVAAYGEECRQQDWSTFANQTRRGSGGNRAPEGADTAKPDGTGSERDDHGSQGRHDDDPPAGGGPSSWPAADPNIEDGFDLSHDALACDIGARMWDRNAKYVAAQSRWYLWTGHWQGDDRLMHMTQARTYLSWRADEVMEWAARKAVSLEQKAAERLTGWAKGEARSLRSANTVAAVVNLARSNTASVAAGKDFDANLLLLGTPGGTVDLRSGELRPAVREEMVTKMTTVAPAPPSTVPVLWQTFLRDIFDGDDELVAFMQRAAGYALTGLTTEHKLLFLFGTGRNGKSTFLNVLLEIWGAYARRVPANSFLSSQGERHPTDIAGLAGARLAVASELPKGRSWDEAVIKDLTGGDRMTARFMRQDFFDFDPQLTLMIAGNTQPSFRGVDEAIRARVVLVPFAVSIPAERRDIRLQAKLLAEGPAILRWAIDGALEWQRRGLAVPDSVSSASAQYMDGEDTLGQFLADETERDPMAFTTFEALHQRFKFWMEKQGLTPWTMHIFNKELKTRGFLEGRRTTGRGFHGLRLA